MRRWKRFAAVLLSMMLLSQSFSVLAEEGDAGQNTGTETAVIDQGNTEDSSAGDAEGNEDIEDNTSGSAEDIGTEPPAPEVSGSEEGEGTENPPMTEPQGTEQQEQVEEEVSGERKAQSAEKATYTLQYEAHVQDLGWQKPVSDGKIAGTTGRAKRLEAVRIKVLKETVDPQTGEKKSKMRL